MILIRMTIFHLKRLLKMPMILFMMIGMPALVNGIMIASQGQRIPQHQVQSQKRLPLCLKREMMSTKN